MDETLSIGVRLTEEGGVEFFGIEEVNARLAAGRRILQLQEGQVYLEALAEEGDEGEEEEGEAYALTGCEITVTFGGSAPTNGRGGGGGRR